MSMKTPDVIVIGGGIIGCAISYYLAKRGAKVTLVERNDLASGTTQAGQGGVGGGTPLTRASVELYSGLTEELSYDIQFTWNGGLSLLIDEEDLSKAALSVDQMRTEGREARLLDQKTVRELEPAASHDVIGGVYFADSGGVDASKTTCAFASASRALGSEILLHTQATEINSKNGRVISVTTEEDEIQAESVVLATGVWAPELAEKLGLSIPVVPRRGHILVTESTPPLESNLSVYQQFGVYAELRRLGDKAAESDNPFVRQGVAWNLIRTGHDSYLVGSSRDFAGFDSSVRPDVVQLLAEQTVRFFPLFKDVSFVRAYSGWRQYTPDVKPIIGEVNEVGGLYLATGFEGEGIMLAPIIGSLLSEIIADGAPSLALDEYRFSRFSEAAGNLN
jgi:sarcosine oxidase subunit beta